MLISEVAATSEAVGSTSSRTAKVDLIADLLRRASPDEVDVVTAMLTGEPRQGRIGVGWATLSKAAEDASTATPARPGEDGGPVEVAEFDAALDVLAVMAGAGSATARRDLLASLLSRMDGVGARFVVGLLGGELRQGALTGVVTAAVAKAAEVPLASVRRAVMFGGRLDAIARVALVEGREGLDEIGLVVGRPVQPMLAAPAASVDEAVEALGEVAVDWKLDGIRIQVHRRGEDISVFSRNLNDLTERLPLVVEVAMRLPVRSVVLDGEALAVGDAGRPALFQDTAAGGSGDAAPRPFFFDLLHLDGRDLIDEPLALRRELLGDLVGELRVPGTVTTSLAEANAVVEEALSAGHEGVVVKDLAATYEAGRRGGSWRKVKPVHTLDLIVLAVEWGSGRRSGLLSNLHLGARSDDGGGFVMVGKTFKGMTDEILRFQTERFLELAVDPQVAAAARAGGPTPPHGVVEVRPEQVVEIALDGVQRSTRYPGGVALRFARLVRHRDDKGPEDVDALATVRALFPDAR